ncbi:PAAR domain-containing protein [Entomomonas asaccharolytica]|uniref:PAAR domain-containing protein n=1 Tax=Entomomonas asaccharolytica TaxID=2785331 RepID=A0A974NIB3_9GAMM|nr:PAAR domain-containing protein [Entomomonas asaccharolytica]
MTINKRKVARVGDALAPYTDANHLPHTRRIAIGSSSVFINRKAVAIEGSKVDCGGVLIASDGTVNIG